MENNIFLEELIGRYPQLESVENEIQKAAERLIICYQQGRKVLVCGNGGSCSDSDHIVGELMKGFEQKRPIGETGGKMKSFCDVLINVHGRRTAFVQELHLPVYHTLCQMVEHSFFGNS